MSWYLIDGKIKKSSFTNWLWTGLHQKLNYYFDAFSKFSWKNHILRHTILIDGRLYTVWMLWIDRRARDVHIYLHLSNRITLTHYSVACYWVWSTFTRCRTLGHLYALCILYTVFGSELNIHIYRSRHFVFITHMRTHLYMRPMTQCVASVCVRIVCVRNSLYTTTTALSNKNKTNTKQCACVWVWFYQRAR